MQILGQNCQQKALNSFKTKFIYDDVMTDCVVHFSSFLEK